MSRSRFRSAATVLALAIGTTAVMSSATASGVLEKSKAIVLSQRADLTVESFVFGVYKPGDPLPGGGIANLEMWTMRWQIRNIGADTVDGGKVVVTCKPKTLLPCPPALAGEYWVGYLVPDSWVTSQGALFGSVGSVGPLDPFPAPDIRARFEFSVTVDPTHQIPETSDANNTLVTQFDSAAYGQVFDLSNAGDLLKALGRK